MKGKKPIKNTQPGRARTRRERARQERAARQKASHGYSWESPLTPAQKKACRKLSEIFRSALGRKLTAEEREGIRFLATPFRPLTKKEREREKRKQEAKRNREEAKKAA